MAALPVTAIRGLRRCAKITLTRAYDADHSLDVENPRDVVRLEKPQLALEDLDRAGRWVAYPGSTSYRLAENVRVLRRCAVGRGEAGGQAAGEAGGEAPRPCLVESPFRPAARRKRVT